MKHASGRGIQAEAVLRLLRIHVTNVAKHDDPDEADVLEDLDSLCLSCQSQEHPSPKE